MPKVPQPLKDPVASRRFNRDGFVVIDAIDPSRLRAALDVYERYDSGIHEGYYASIHSRNRDYRVRVDAELREIVWPPCEDLLADHQCLFAAFMVKPPSGSTVVPLHQDWNTVNESSTAGITCWVPLTPITEAEGLMRVLPGSHHFMGGLRGSPGFPAPYQDISDRIERELLVDVEVRQGQVLIMDGRVLHTTGPNVSGRTRVAAYMNAIPNGVQPIHYYRREDGGVEGYEVEIGFYTSFNIGERPVGTPFETIDRYQPDSIDMKELLLRRRRAKRRALLGMRR